MSERLKNYAVFARELVAAQLSNALFGNDVGVRNNLKGRREMRTAHIARDAAWPFRDPQAEELHNVGVVQLPGIYADGVIQPIASRFAKIIDDPAHSMARRQSAERGQPEASRILVDPIGSIPALTDLINDDVQSVLKSYYGGHFRWIDVAAYRNRHVPDDGREYYSNAWHYDHIHTAYLQLFVYLSDASNGVDAGAFQFHTKANSRRLSRSGYLNRRIVVGPARRMIDDAGLVRSMEGGAGTAFVVANAFCLHRAGVPGPAHHRDAAVFSFVPATEPFDGRLHRLANHSYDA